MISGIIKESYFLLKAMAPYLLFGFLFAGILHIFISTGTVSRHLGRSSLLSVVTASLFGIPLPLCSCSVIPAAMSLRREGASRGAVLSFLISTPTTGVDSIFATYSLLGGLFTVYRIIASFITGVLAGAAANIFIKEEPTPAREVPKCKLCDEEKEHVHGTGHRIKGVFSYAFGDLLEDTGLALLAGILMGGVITYFLPETFIETYLGSGLKEMFIMLLVGIPMYVCATASIPIAAALMIKGLGPGAAFVFLVAGPATNIVTMSVVAKNMGRKALIIYLGSIAVSSITLGLVLDKIFTYFYEPGSIHFMMHAHRRIIPDWLTLAATVLLIALICRNFIVKFLKKRNQ